LLEEDMIVSDVEFTPKSANEKKEHKFEILDHDECGD
jgi:hypothetical protein